MKRFISLLAVIALLAAACCIPVNALQNDPKWVEKDHADGVEYSFALVGDTQILAAFDAGNNLQGEDPDIYHNQGYMDSLYQWIVDNKDEKKIEYVFGLGDITQHPSWNDRDLSRKEWEVAGPAISKLAAAGIPYSMVRGNHDRADFFNDYIGTEYYKSNHTFYIEDPADDPYTESEGTGADTVITSYRTFSINGTDYLFINLDICPTDGALKWASELVADHPDHKVIINTHGYLANGGNYWAHSSGHPYATSGNSGQQIWDELVKNHENIFMVVCGHIGADTLEVSTAVGTNGNTVYQVLVNPQDIDVGKNPGVPGDEDPIGGVGFLNFYADGSFGFEYCSVIKSVASEANDGKSIYYSDIKTYIPDTIVTDNVAQARIDADNSGLRFKTTIDDNYIKMIRNTYGAENVEVGTLIAPADYLGAGKLTHKSGVEGKDYVDVQAYIDSPYATEGSKELNTLKNIYTGSIVKIKGGNQNRDFTAVGYIKYKAHNGDVVYIYSSDTATRSVASVAMEAYKDTSTTRTDVYANEFTFAGTLYYSKYTADDRAILKTLASKSSDFDPFLPDKFN